MSFFIKGEIRMFLLHLGFAAKAGPPGIDFFFWVVPQGLLSLCFPFPFCFTFAFVLLHFSFA